MSIADCRAYRRRFAQLVRSGQGPRKIGHSTAQSIAREQARAQRERPTAKKGAK